MMPGNGSSSVGVLTDHPSFIRCVVFHHVTGHPQLVFVVENLILEKLLILGCRCCPVVPARWCPVVPAQCRWSIEVWFCVCGGDDAKKNGFFNYDGAARTAEGRFLNLQPHFCSL
ncbi:hypothetical protein HanRHA438_Chr03g0103131 [Helianthus annuus]|nr:hypothetical protein HanRHA438_Chr03g0103131 [Helianthus annuus]